MTDDRADVGQQLKEASDRQTAVLREIQSVLLDAIRFLDTKDHK